MKDKTIKICIENIIIGTALEEEMQYSTNNNNPQMAHKIYLNTLLFFNLIIKRIRKFIKILKNFIYEI